MTDSFIIMNKRRSSTNSVTAYNTRKMSVNLGEEAGIENSERKKGQSKNYNISLSPTKTNNSKKK